jgi:hypothetical protein
MNDNDDSSTLRISTSDPITQAWFYLGPSPEAVVVGAAENTTAGTDSQSPMSSTVGSLAYH